jgi:hypothetical protein
MEVHIMSRSDSTQKGAMSPIVDPKDPNAHKIQGELNALGFGDTQVFTEASQVEVAGLEPITVGLIAFVASLILGWATMAAYQAMAWYYQLKEFEGKRVLVLSKAGQIYVGTVARGKKPWYKSDDLVLNEGITAANSQKRVLTLAPSGVRAMFLVVDALKAQAGEEAEAVLLSGGIVKEEKAAFEKRVVAELNRRYEVSQQDTNAANEADAANAENLGPRIESAMERAGEWLQGLMGQGNTAPTTAPTTPTTTPTTTPPTAPARLTRVEAETLMGVVPKATLQGVQWPSNVSSATAPDLRVLIGGLGLQGVDPAALKKSELVKLTSAGKQRASA